MFFSPKRCDALERFRKKETSKHEHQADDMADKDTVSLYGPDAKELNENSNIMTVICDTILCKRYYTNNTEYCFFQKYNNLIINCTREKDGSINLFILQLPSQTE